MTESLPRPPPLLFTGEDVDRAHAEWGCNCGPAALAAVTARTLGEVRAAMPDFERKHFTSPTMMWRALESLGAAYVKRGAGGRAASAPALQWPYLGLARVQFGGPWCAEGVPIQARYRETHWVGACRTDDANIAEIYDVNHAAWMTLGSWREVLVPALLAERARADGTWWLTHSVEVRP